MGDYLASGPSKDVARALTRSADCVWDTGIGKRWAHGDSKVVAGSTAGLTLDLREAWLMQLTRRRRVKKQEEEVTLPYADQPALPRSS